MPSKLSSLTIQNNLEQILNHLRPYLSLANCHMVNYLVDDLWLKMVPKDIQNEIKCENTALRAIEQYWQLNEISDQSIGAHEFTGFCKYLLGAQRNCLEELNHLWITPEKLKSKLNCELEDDILRIKGFMSEKKMHEVEVTADVVACICANSAQANKNPMVIDAGDGKGYLSSRLALQYKLEVLGVDANSVNTNGAMSRLGKLERTWEALEQQAKGIITPKGGRRKLQRPTTLPSKTLEIVPKSENYKVTTHFITTKTDFIELLHENFPAANAPNPSICLSGLHTCGDLAPSCLRIFHECDQIHSVCNIGCCYHLLTEQFSHPSNLDLPKIRFRMFEGKSIQFEQKEDTLEGDTTGFPMSKYLYNQQFSIGRNARMLACQSIQRTIDAKETPHDHLFFRALLEILIVDKYPKYRNAINVGRVKKCDTFVEYVRKCSKRIDIVDFDGVSDQELYDIERKYSSHRQIMNVFFLLRLSLAPILESVILLDRLLYLKEQNEEGNGDMASIYLVKMFDYIVSPRCFGIIGVK